MLNCFSLKHHKIEEVIRLNKKIFMMVIALIAVAMMVTPLVATAQACGWQEKSIQTFTLDPAVDPPTIRGYTETVAPTEKIVAEGTIRLAWGAVRVYEYNGILGHGWITGKTIYSVSDWPAVGNAGEGHGIYLWTMVLDTDAGYGTGTLEGCAYLRWEFDSTVVPLPRFEQWTNARLYGRGDLKGMTVLLDTYATMKPPLPLYKDWFTKTTIIS
jgi:hypothetical protein